MLFRSLTGCGVIIPDEALEDYARHVASLPERMEAQQFDQGRRQEQQQETREALGREPGQKPDEGQSIDLDNQQAEAAKRRLKRW